MLALSSDPNSWKRIQGLGFDEIYQDEALGNEDLGKELMMRLMAARTARINGQRSWGGGRTWVATETLVNDEFTQYKKNCEEGLPGYKFLWINPNENPAISMEVRESMRSSMSAEDAAIRLDGTSGAVQDVLIYRHQWNRNRHVLPTAEPVGPRDNIWCAWDPGWDHPYGLLFGVINQFHPNQIRIVQCYRERHKTLDHVANQIATYLNGRFLEGMVFDPAALKTEHSRGESLSIQMETMLGKMQVKSIRGVMYGRNRYEDTIPLMQRYLDPDPLDRNKIPLIVIDQPNESNGTAYLIDQLVKYRRKLVQKGASLRGHNIHREDDDLADPLRYLVSRQPAWAEREPNNAKSINFSPGPTRYANTKPDPYALTDTMDEGQRIHVMRLRESASRSMFQRDGLRSLPVSALGW
jgi:hypothetical protein